MQTNERLPQTFVLTNQAPKMGNPGKAVLDHLTLGQRHEARLGVGQFDNLNRMALGFGNFAGLPSY